MKKETYFTYLRSCFVITCLIGMFVIPSIAAQLPPDSNRMQKGFLPTPFSAEQIRANCPYGRTIVYQIETFGKPLFFRTMTFGTDSGEGTVVEEVTTGIDGKMMGKKQMVISTWKELQAHASFPAAKTEIKAEKLTTPLGSFDCWVYTVQPGKNESSIKRIWFAKTLPGPPVCYEESSGGNVTYRMIMLKNNR